MHVCYSSTHKAEAELLNLWHWDQHASKGYIARPCSNINHLNPTLWYVGMSVAPGSCSQDQETRVQLSDFLLRLLCLLTPWSWKHKCVLDEEIGDGETFHNLVYNVLDYLSYRPDSKVMSVPDTNKFSNCNSYCPVRVETRWLLPGWGQGLRLSRSPGDGSSHLKNPHK